MTDNDDTRQAALTYAAHGWPVLRCWQASGDGCACAKGERCESPGKHPYKTAHGVKDATTDLDAIAAWRGQWNVAVALGHRNLLALDIDDDAVGRAINRTAEAKATGRVRTRRGLHLYFLTADEPDITARDIFDRKTGDEIGQIRGRDHYVVAPPSVGRAGKRYRWLGDLVDPWTPKLATCDDPVAYTVQLLAAAGYDVEVASSVPTGELQVDGEIAEAAELPDALKRITSLRDVRLILEGKMRDRPYADEDRSRSFQRCAAMIAYAAAKQHIRLDELELAALLKGLDRRYFDKYTGRRPAAADREYLRSARKVLTLPSAALVDGAGAGSGGRDLDDAMDGGNEQEQTYLWDAEAEQLLYVRQQARGRTYQTIANYLPEITATAIIDDPDEPEPEVAWRLHAARNGRERMLSLRADDYKRSRGLAATLVQRLPHNFSIAKGGEDHILPAIQELSAQDVPSRRVPAVPGWYQHDGAWVYVLPGAEVAVSGGGVEQSFLLHRDDLRAEDAMRYGPIQRYGLGFRPPQRPQDARKAWRAFRTALEAARPEIAACVALQALGGPLFDAGLAEVPPLVHVVGRTGTLKTSYCLAVLSIWGSMGDAPPVTWRSTPNGLAEALHRARHMTLLIDDYKRAVGRRRDMIGLIQQYADGSHMVRHSISGAALERPRGLILSNGEDRFRGEASVAARTTTVEVKDGDINQDKLAAAQDAGERGVLAGVGAMYVSWLARSGVLGDDSLRDARDAAHRRLLASEGVVAGHRRTLRSAASLLAVGEIVLRFVDEVCEHRPTRRAIRRVIESLDGYFVDTSQERAVEIEEVGPLEHMMRLLSDKLAAGEVKLRHRRGTRRDDPDRPQARVVGWYDEDTIYLSDNLTFSYYEEDAKRRGNEPAHDWSSITQNIREAFPDAGQQVRIRPVDPDTGESGDAPAPRRVFAVPRRLVADPIHSKTKKRQKRRNRRGS